MIRRIRVGMLVLLILCLSPLGVRAESFDYQLSGNQVFFIGSGLGQTGQLWKGSIKTETQGLFAEYLKVDDYFDQLGAGLEVILLNHPKGRAWHLMGMDRYRVFEREMTAFREGLRLELPVFFGEMEIGFDVMLSKDLGIFPKYYTEVKFNTWQVKGNLGVGNLLGSGDGYACWVGIEI